MEKCSNKNIFILINLENDKYYLNNNSLLQGRCFQFDNKANVEA